MKLDIYYTLLKGSHEFMNLKINDVMTINSITTVISSTKQVDYSAKIMNKIKQNGFAILNNSGNKITINVKDIKCSFSLSGDILVAIKIDEVLAKEEVVGCDILIESNDF